MNRNSTYRLAQASVTAALYIVLTIVSSAMGLASGAVQVRLSEALTVLPCFIPSAVPGLFVGCLLSNLITGCSILDVVFGSLGTLVAAFATYLLKSKRYLASIPPVIVNMIIVPLLLKFAYGLNESVWYLVLTVGIGEFISAGVWVSFFTRL